MPTSRWRMFSPSSIFKQASLITPASGVKIYAYNNGGTLQLHVRFQMCRSRTPTSHKLTKETTHDSCLRNGNQRPAVVVAPRSTAELLPAARELLRF